MEWESKKTGAGETAHVIKHWPCKHKGPSSIPRTYVKTQAFWFALVIPGLRRRTQENLVSDFLLTEKLHLKKKKKTKTKLGGRGAASETS